MRAVFAMPDTIPASERSAPEVATAMRGAEVRRVTRPPLWCATLLLSALLGHVYDRHQASTAFLFGVVVGGVVRNVAGSSPLTWCIWGDPSLRLGQAAMACRVCSAVTSSVVVPSALSRSARPFWPAPQLELGQTNAGRPSSVEFY